MGDTYKKPTCSIKSQLRCFVLKVKAKCCYCGKGYRSGRLLTVDHVIPKSAQGTSELSNLLVCCCICNSVKKKSIPLEEFIINNPKSRYFLTKYFYKIKTCIINGKSYHSEIEWIRKIVG